ncbi:MAG: Nramp family divalent metal transporter [Sphingobacteriaceae bacterium]
MSKKHSESLGEVHGSVNTQNKVGWRKWFAFLGPAYLVSVGYMDPGNWATDLAGGSQFGYRLIWILLLSNLMALLLQSLSSRLGIVRGLDLAQASKKAYPPFVNFCLYVLAQISIIACDLAEIIGMAIGLQLLFGLPLIWGVSITILDTFLLLFLLNRGMRHLEGFIVSMIFIIGISFFIEMLIVKPNILEIAQGFKPSNLSGDALYIAIGIIGATVMPHNLYLHSSLVQTRKITRTPTGIRTAIRMNFFDTTIALNLAFLVNASILILAAAAFYKNGHFEVAEIQDAYHLLQNIFGSLAPALFAIALIASGQSSTITGTLAGQIIMEGHLNLRIEPWIRRLITRLFAILPAFFTIMYFGDQALGSLLILSQVVLSLQLGFAIVPLIHFNSDKQSMGEFAIKPIVKVFSWASALLIILLNMKLVIEEISSWIKDSPTESIWIYSIVIPITLGICALLLYIFLKPIFHRSEKKTQVPHGHATPLSDLNEVNYSHIGVTIDFSDNDKNTIRHALMQGGRNAQYTLIHIVETAGARYHGHDVLDNETQTDQQNLDEYVKNLQTLGYKTQSKIGFGMAPKSISNIVKAEKIDFLVMGAHGHRGIKDIIFGTTVDAVRHQVDIPVLIIR